MATISLCMIVKNEAAILSRCLDSVCDLMDEIIIVDTGSTDDPGKSKFQQCIIDLKTAASAAYHHPVAVCLRRTDCVLCGLRDLAFFVDHCSVYIKKYYLFIHSTTLPVCRYFTG